ncbi:hypothetical protein DFA_01288 [Cavenderia fasciculata]|uniref:FAR-17a/AIG1-like protein n=1 Tax=Cavenderia fasciculata TaxID=261658 RepID=F4PRW8_CACFS|nr:uncharacterized protein DFA_01288 [Cavenderia fasciculata]EGG21404.1 hypothetical protein DFA_01288 [Cavenderia fasciculata]|eukprot:XP_004359254.1 hypothetical protein DFA_01288 [Cavenderia fasciculata]
MSTLLKLVHVTLFITITYGLITFYHAFIKFGSGITGTNHPLMILTFLTFWGQIIYTFYYFWVVMVDMVDLFGLKSSAPNLYQITLKARDSTFRSLVFPVGLIVSILFWGLYVYDRNFIYPPTTEAVYPLGLNHIQHTIPAFAAIFEMMLVNHQYHHQLSTGTTTEPSTANVYSDVVNLISFLLFYMSLFLASKVYLGRWPYPFLGVIPVYSKVIFVFSSCCFFVSIYTIGRMIAFKRWGGKSEFPQPARIRRNINTFTTTIKSNKLD